MFAEISRHRWLQDAKNDEEKYTPSMQESNELLAQLYLQHHTKFDPLKLFIRFVRKEEAFGFLSKNP